MRAFYYEMFPYDLGNSEAKTRIESDSPQAFPHMMRRIPLTQVGTAAVVRTLPFQIITTHRWWPLSVDCPTFFNRILTWLIKTA